MKTRLNSEPLIVTKWEDISQILDVIHDEYFDLDAIKFDHSDRVLEIPYRRIFHDCPGKLIRNWLVFKTYEVDVIHSKLTIRNVEEYSANDRSHIGTYSFNRLSYTDGTLLIESNEDLDLRMVVPSINIESRDLEIRGKARIREGLFWDSSESKFYE